MRIIIVIITILILGGCNYQKQLNIDIRSAHYLNPDDSHLAKPIAVSIYELSRKLPFKRLGFKDIISTTAMGETLIDYQQYEIIPSSKKTINLTLPESAHYIGIIGGYHHLSLSQWKTIIEIPKTYKKASLKLFIGTTGISYKFEEHLL